MKRDIFQMVALTGGLAPLFDWKNHLAGYDEIKKGNVIVMASNKASTMAVHSPRSLSRTLVYIESPTAKGGIAWDFASSESYQLDYLDVTVHQVDWSNLGKWLCKLLRKGAKRHVEFTHEKLLHLFDSPIPVYFLLPCEPVVQENLMKTLSLKGSSIVLTCSIQAIDSPEARHYAATYPNCHLYHISDFIGVQQDARRYEYIHRQSFDDFLNQHEQEPPKPTFMARLPGSRWEDLEILLISDDKAPDGPGERDILFAKYKGTTSREYHRREWVKKIPELKGKNKNRSVPVQLLRKMARNGGISTSEDASAISRLRNYLRKMFGFNEDPISNEERNATFLEPEFTIRFANGNSDPLLREACLVPFTSELESCIDSSGEFTKRPKKGQNSRLISHWQYVAM